MIITTDKASSRSSPQQRREGDAEAHSGYPPLRDKDEHTLEAIIAAVLTRAVLDTAREHTPNAGIKEHHLMRGARRHNGGIFAEPHIKQPWEE
jgi:hypothetical protein